MDIRKLCMEADAEVVADYIQMDTRRKGKYTYICLLYTSRCV